MISIRWSGVGHVVSTNKLRLNSSLISLLTTKLQLRLWLHTWLDAVSFQFRRVSLL